MIPNFTVGDLKAYGFNNMTVGNCTLLVPSTVNDYGTLGIILGELTQIVAENKVIAMQLEATKKKEEQEKEANTQKESVGIIEDLKKKLKK